MKKIISVKQERPQYVTITGITFAQVDSWFGHCTRDLKLDLIYPEDKTKKYPCIVWICGGAWQSLDKSAHLAYLSRLALNGFVVASVEYRTTNEAKYPACVEDVKAAIRYLRAHADRYNIDIDKFGTMGESAGGYLTAMTALATSKKFDVGEYKKYSSAVQAAICWYPPASFDKMQSAKSNPGSPESLLLGKDVGSNLNEAKKICPINFITNQAPPIMIIHGQNDHTVPVTQGELLHDELEKNGTDVTLIEIKDADHADIRFFQDKIWDLIIGFFKEKL